MTIEQYASKLDDYFDEEMWCNVYRTANDILDECAQSRDTLERIAMSILLLPNDILEKIELADPSLYITAKHILDREDRP